MLIIVTLGGIIIFLVMVMLALLNVKLFFMRDQSRDLDSILKDDHCEDLLELDPDEGAIFTIEGKHQDKHVSNVWQCCSILGDGSFYYFPLVESAQ